MANMSYCQFENTYKDLDQCFNTLNEKGGIEQVQQDANENEKQYVQSLVDLCKEIAEEYGNMIEDYED